MERERKDVKETKVQRSCGAQLTTTQPRWRRLRRIGQNIPMTRAKGTTPGVVGALTGATTHFQMDMRRANGLPPIRSQGSMARGPPR